MQLETHQEPFLKSHDLLKKHSVEILDITHAIRDMMEHQSLLNFEGPSVRPRFTEKILSLLLIMEWPFFNGTLNGVIKVYGAIFNHGRTHVAEVYFMNEFPDHSESNKYMGTSKVYSINLPHPKILESDEMGDAIAQFIAQDLGLQIETND